MTARCPRGPDAALIAVTLLLLCAGLVMVYSSSSIMAEQKFGSQYYFLKRQAAAAIAGFGLLVLFSRLRYAALQKFALPILVASVALLAAVWIPGIGVRVGGAQRWIHLPGFNVQPSEIAKLALVLFSAMLLTRKGNRVREFVPGVLPLLTVGGVLVLLLLAQPDYGAAVTMIALVGIMLFVAGTRVSYMVYGLLAAPPCLVLLAATSSYRWARLLAFFDPWATRSGSGYQIVQSFLAFGAGGWFGAGLGDGRQKLMYLPEAHTDFIFSVVGEELGLAGVTVIVALYATLVWRGFRIAMDAPDPFGAYVALGITSLLGLQAMMNMGVVMGLLPTKGLTLPLMSYGGSSLIVSLTCVGILLAIGMQSAPVRR